MYERRYLSVLIASILMAFIHLAWADEGPYQSYRGGAPYASSYSSGALQRSMDRIERQERRNARQATSASQAHRQRAINACNMIQGSPAAQRTCFLGIP